MPVKDTSSQGSKITRNLNLTNDLFDARGISTPSHLQPSGYNWKRYGLAVVVTCWLVELQRQQTTLGTYKLEQALHCSTRAPSEL
jgi:hypothetical protein